MNDPTMNTSVQHTQQHHPQTAAGRLFEPAPSCIIGEPTNHPVHLAIETVVVTVGVVALLGILSSMQAHHLQWFVVPGVLTLAALLPAWIAKRDFPRFGFDLEHIALSLGTVCRLSIYVFPILFLALWVIRYLELAIPLQPILAGRKNGITWLLYQFLYVAVAEEVFFRGYVQANVMSFLDRVPRLSWIGQQRIAILLSAACFAAAHVVVQGHALSVLTFLPGLLLAWLFIETRSLLAPILFHGLANVSYGIMAITLA